jgi:GT2 family glycosyltransferase
LLSGAQIDKEGGGDIQRYKAMLSRKWSEPLRSKQGRPLKKEEVFLTAANFSVPRKLFYELNGFDENLTDAEDFDLAVRANAAGIPVYYDHRAFALHEDPVTGQSYIKRQRQYRAAHKELFNRFPSRYVSFRDHTPKEPKGLKKAFFRFFCSPFWIKWLDKRSGKKLLPKKLRYKLYDWIITANGVYYPESSI